MTVREVMEFLSHCDPEAEVVPCDWDETVALRVFHDHQCQELRWEMAEDEDEDDD